MGQQAGCQQNDTYHVKSYLLQLPGQGKAVERQRAKKKDKRLILNHPPKADGIAVDSPQQGCCDSSLPANPAFADEKNNYNAQDAA